MSRILVVEDEPAIAELISINLRHAGFEVTVAGDADAGAGAGRRRAAGPGRPRLDAARAAAATRWRAQWRAEPRTRELPVIMLTARADEADKVSGLDAGADDYLTKPFSANELLARIRALLRRQSPDALDAAVEVGALKLDPATRRVTGHGREVKIGATEFKLLHFLMTHPERVHSRTQLLDRVWGDHVFIEERTVDVHIKRCARRSTPVDCQHMIETVRGAGYRLARPQTVPGLNARAAAMSGLLPRFASACWRCSPAAWSPGCCVGDGNGTCSARCSAALLGFAAVVVVRRAARLAPDALAARRAGHAGAARHRLLGRDRLSHRAQPARSRAQRPRPSARAWRSSSPPWKRRRTACCCSTPATRSSGATRAPPITSASTRSATGASASPT